MWYEVAKEVAESIMAEMDQHVPAIVIAYDASKRKATVQPLIKYRDRSAGVDAKGLVDMPVIQGVPVMMLGTDEALINIPVKAGSKVMLCFSSTAGDTFKLSNNEQTVDPDDTRVFDVNDCYCIPVAPIAFSRAVGSDSNDLRLIMNLGTGNECSVSLKPSGEVVIDSPTTVTVNATSEVVVNTELATVNASSEVVVNTATATVNASDSVTIDSPQTTCTGELRVDGGVSIGSDVQTDAGFSGNTHVHIGNLSKPTSKFV